MSAAGAPVVVLLVVVVSVGGALVLGIGSPWLVSVVTMLTLSREAISDTWGSGWCTKACKMGSNWTRFGISLALNNSGVAACCEVAQVPNDKDRVL